MKKNIVKTKKLECSQTIIQIKNLLYRISKGNINDNLKRCKDEEVKYKEIMNVLDKCDSKKIDILKITIEMDIDKVETAKNFESFFPIYISLVALLIATFSVSPSVINSNELVKFVVCVAVMIVFFYSIYHSLISKNYIKANYILRIIEQHRANLNNDK